MLLILSILLPGHSNSFDEKSKERRIAAKALPVSLAHLPKTYFLRHTFDMKAVSNDF